MMNKTFMFMVFIGLASFVLAQEIDAEAFSRKLDELYRSKSSSGTITMIITTPRYRRTLKMDIWSFGKEYTLVKIRSPKKEKGISTLKKGTEMWNYLPKIKKLIRIPPSMMMSSWMGSDFTNDDLVKESSWEDDYTVKEGEPEGTYKALVFTPRPEAAVTWGKVVVLWDMELELPVRQDNYDEKGVKVREMHFLDPKELGGRTLPSILKLVPLNKIGQQTEIIYDAMEFDIDIDETYFSKTQMRR